MLWVQLIFTWLIGPKRTYSEIIREHKKCVNTHNTLFISIFVTLFVIIFWEEIKLSIIAMTWCSLTRFLCVIFCLFFRRTREIFVVVDWRALFRRDRGTVGPSGAAPAPSGPQEAGQPPQGGHQDPQEVALRPPVQRLPQRRRESRSSQGSQLDRSSGEKNSFHLF